MLTVSGTMTARPISTFKYMGFIVSSKREVDKKTFVVTMTRAIDP